MQGLVPFNRAPLWKNFPNHERKEPQRSAQDKESLLFALPNGARSVYPYRGRPVYE